jgi:Flp pilus assembly protein TadD
MPNVRRFASLTVLMLGCTALTTGMAGTAQAGWFDFGSSKSDAKTVKEAPKEAPAATRAATLDDSIRQAQVLRQAGSYDGAIKHLSQLMMVASDDPRVIGEYGKTLAAMGRASDGISFLTRAQQLQPNDWTIYSALGVAYDQVGNQKDAQIAYEHALMLKPGEASVLSNYALSRLLAKDSAMAANLAGRAEIANAARDEKIARNIVMVRSMLAGKPADTAVALNKPAPKAQVAPLPTPAFVNLPAPQPAPRQPVQRQVVNNPPAPQPAPQNSVIQAQPQFAQQMTAPVASGVVMQRVPVDPFAGPVIGATRAPRTLQPRKTETVAKAEPIKPEPAPPAPVKAAATTKPLSEAESLQARAEALAKTLANKPGALAAAKTEANKDRAAKNEVSKPIAAMPAQSKPAAPKVLAPTVRAAEAKPAAPTKTAAKAKDAVPALRVSSSAF